MFWTFTFTNPREQAKMSKNQFSQIHNSVTHCVATHLDQISISGMRRSEVSTTSCSRTFTSGSSPMAWFSTASGLNIIQQIHIIFKMEVFECLPYIMEHQWYIWTVPENNSCPQKAFWNTFLSCLFLKNQIFSRSTYFHIFPHISTYFHIFPHISTYISLYDIFKSGPDQSRDIQTPFSVDKVEA